MKKFSANATLMLLAISLLPLFGSAARADTSNAKLPLWEVGIAAGAIQIPHYVGSDQNYSIPLALPYVIYRGDFLKADREGIRGEFFKSDSLSLDVGFSFGLPVKSSNRAREGMPDLHLTGQIGPRLNWAIGQSESGTNYTFHLPVRYAADVKNNKLGWIAEPSLVIEKKKLGNSGRFAVQFDAGLLYAGRKYNQYYYEVEPEFALPNRPAYQASSGLNHYFMGFGTSYKYSDRLNLNAFVHWKSLASSVIDDSPLVKDDDYFAFGIGMTWLFKTSD